MEQKEGAAPENLEQVLRVTKEMIAQALGVPPHLLVEPGHVMSKEKYRELYEQQK